MIIQVWFEQGSRKVETEIRREMDCREVESRNTMPECGEDEREWSLGTMCKEEIGAVEWGK